MAFIHLSLAAPSYVEHRDTGDEHCYPRISAMKVCPECGAPQQPEPTDEERARIFADPDYHWFAPKGLYLAHGFGLLGGGYGPYVLCDRCDFFFKEQIDE